MQGLTKCVASMPYSHLNASYASNFDLEQNTRSIQTIDTYIGAVLKLVNGIIMGLRMCYTERSCAVTYQSM